MKRFLLSTAALLLMGTSAFAQNANFNRNTSNSNSSSGAVSGSTSTSTSGSNNAGNAQNITFNSPAIPTTTTQNDNVRYSGGTNSTITTNGDQTIRNAPTVYAPPVSGGNPCTLAVSGGASFLGWGAAAGGTFVDQDCADRQKIAMIWNAGFKEASKELMCNDHKTYNAFKSVGQPCAVRPDWEPKTVGGPTPIAPPPVYQPAPPPPAPMVQRKEYPRCNPKAGIVDNCQS
jgi:hypothetical protein